MHGKEHIISPLIKKDLPAKVEVIQGFNTDVFGTFAWEVQRKELALETLRNKLLAALTWSGETLGLANEGSFGPHALYSFLSVYLEHVMLIDTLHGFEIIGSEISLHTNFLSAIVLGQLTKDFRCHAGL
ncbi:DUF6671 family protein [Chryseolinea lacunae]|uniref:DUF6671 domain-containing protein n=1 Tax=Chryseolinea lacunae TaxID=2801331 RepID=A0ABS1L464_9BACT|nr:DUF6671 family protein [Chryseolinea lacunae]MBL0745732.1 hypothetical protein [Chryseolinea lacunae]